MSMEKFNKLMEKKKSQGKEISPMARDAKMGVLKDLHKMASDSMNSKINGLKKVTVAAPDQEGLEHGLDKAKQIVGDMPGMLSDAESGHSNLENHEEEMGEDFDDDNEEGATPEHMHAVMGDDHEDEASIDAKLAELMAKKHAMQSRKA